MAWLTDWGTNLEIVWTKNTSQKTSRNSNFEWNWVHADHLTEISWFLKNPIFNQPLDFTKAKPNFTNYLARASLHNQKTDIIQIEIWKVQSKVLRINYWESVLIISFIQRSNGYNRHENILVECCLSE